MLAKLVKENQRDWDVHIRTALHESSGFSPYHLVFGRSPTLPLDLVLGRADFVASQQSVPEYVDNLHKSLTEAFDCARQRLSTAHHRAKLKYDQRARGIAFQIGDLVWLYTPAVKQGRTKKLSCLWCGPYTVLDRTGDHKYRIQLIGSTHSLVVHRNRLKHCYGTPGSHPKPAASKPASQQLPRMGNPTPPAHNSILKEGLSTQEPPRSQQPTYAEVARAHRPQDIGGYTSSHDIGRQDERARTPRPREQIRAPVRYGTSAR